MNNDKPIYWHQGLFLKPHHFQHLESYQQEKNLTIVENIKPYFWGISKLVIDEKELLNKNFLIQDLELIFMDGTIVKMPQNAIVTAHSFEKIDEKNLKVYIGMKSFSKKSPNVTEVDSYENIQSVDTRFISKKDAKAVNNLYHNDDAADIQFMDYYLKIFFEEEVKNLDNYQIIPISNVKIEAEKIFLADDFTPPLLNIEADSNFYDIIKQIQKNLTSHAIQLEEYKLPSDSLIDEPNYMKYIMALQVLAKEIPMLNHLIKTPNIHPWEYYGLLAKLIGELSIFSTRVNFSGRLENGNYLLQEYSHYSLYECFNDIKILLGELLDSIIIGPDYILEFTKDETIYSLDCPVLIFNAKYRYFIVLKSPTDARKIQESFKDFAKISTASELETIVQRSLLGLPFELYNLPIQGLPQREDSCYFELLTDDLHWAKIQQAQNICIEFDDTLDDVSIELVVLKK